jgi:hypothetical protein
LMPNKEVPTKSTSPWDYLPWDRLARVNLVGANRRPDAVMVLHG